MKTRNWLIIFGSLALVCGLLTFWLFAGARGADSVEIWSEGERICTLSLYKDQTIVVDSDKGENTIRIENGAVAVIHADCPDQHCVQRGFCSGGAQIVCLPHELIIKFAGKQAVDGTAG